MPPETPPSVRPTVAIVGRPNVGKSTLFNRLTGRRQAIVHDQPGVTRDRLAAVAELAPDASVHLIDTGGLVPDGDDPLGLNRQVLFAVEESDLLLFVVDGKEGLLPADEQVWERLRRQGRPAILVVNKADTRRAEESYLEFYRLGLAPQLLVSSEHGLGIAALREAILERLPPRFSESAGPAALDPETPPVAIVGRPNVGKSSLLNRLVGSERSLVSETAGTTRDPVDTLVEHDGHRFLLVDTAGIRRRAKVHDAPEELAVMMARRQLERAQLAVLVVDADAGIMGGDMAVAGAAWEQGRGVLVAVNKWDLLDADRRERLEKDWPRLASLLADPLRLNVSAHTGRGVAGLLPALAQLHAAYRMQLDTGELNRMFERAVARHHAPSDRGRPWRMYYATQVATGPPTFMLFANRTLPRSSSYRRYLENQIRTHLQAPGVPIRLVIRKRG
ncbi:MAG: ribosome biogenesis GTPase Der [Thermoanaerobaculia bacterium]